MSQVNPQLRPKATLITDPYGYKVADVNNNALDVNVVSSPSVGPTGNAVPASADFIGFNSSGNLVGVSAANPLPITGTITFTPPANASTNITQWNSVALGSPSLYGTPPGAVNVIGVNAFITNTPAVTLTSTTITGTVAITQSTSPWVVSMTSTTVTGTVAVTQSTSPWVVSNGGTFAVQATCTQSTSPWIIAGGGTAGVSGTAVLTVQGIAGGTAIPISGTVTTTPPANASTNVTQWNGNTVDTNSGNKSIGTLRVVLATDQPNLASALNITGTVNIAAAQTIAVTQATASSLNATVTRATPLASAYSYAAISTAANPAVFVAAVGGQTIRVYRILIVNAGTATNVTIEDSTPTAFSGAIPLIANGSLQADGDGDPLWVTASGKAFQAVNSASQSLVGEVWYTQS